MADYTFTCDHCGHTYTIEGHNPEKAHDESVQAFGLRGDAPGMAEVCDRCYAAIMTWLSAHPEEQPAWMTARPKGLVS